MNQRRNRPETTRKILGGICFFVSCTLFVAAFWPFNLVPPNEVGWLANEGGLWFGKNATIFSSGVFGVPRSSTKPFCSVEIWLQPAFAGVKSSETILSFYTPDNPGKFRLMQYLDQFLVQRDYRDPQNHLATAEIKVEHAFHRDERVLFTITSNRKGTSVYRNGVFAESDSRFDLTCASFSGQLVIGNSQVIYDAWQGRLFGVAFYSQSLTREQISRHYESWSHCRVRQGFREDGLVALYSFAEGAGRMIHDSLGASPDLYIPQTFKILHKRLLTPPWEEFSPDLGYAWDLFINVIGFVPFGFFFYAYFVGDRPGDRAALLTVALGGLTSLAIEILQWFLPSRSSGVTDIIANTLGSGVGVILWRLRVVQDLVGSLTGEDPSP